MLFKKGFAPDHSLNSTSQGIKNQVFVAGPDGRDNAYVCDKKSNSSKSSEPDSDQPRENRGLGKTLKHSGRGETGGDEYTGVLSGRPLQVAVTLMVCLMFMCSGSVLAFPSVILSDLQEQNTTIYGGYIHFNAVEQDLMGSLASVGAVFGVWFGGLCGKTLGKRRILMCVSLAGCFSWVAIALSPYSVLCLAFRVLNGCVYGCVAVAGTAYTIEIADNVMRGPLTVGGSASIGIGQVLSVVPAYWLRYYHVAFVDCICPITFFFLSVLVMPDSPSALVLTGRQDKARQILSRLRIKGTDVDAEIRGIEDINKLHQEANVLKALTSSDVIRRLCIVFALFFIQVFSGYTVFVAQTARILEDSGSTVEATIATLMVQVAQLFGIFASVFLVTRLGRRGCLLVSHVSMAVSVAALAVYVHKTEPSPEHASLTSVDPSAEAQTWLMPHEDEGAINRASAASPLAISVRWLGDYLERTSAANGTQETGVSGGETGSYGWVPLVCLMCAQLGACVGVQSFPFILSSEYFPTVIRPQAASICITVGMVIWVINLQLYSPLQAALTQAGLLFLHCAVSVAAIPFTFFIVQETVGNSVG